MPNLIEPKLISGNANMPLAKAVAKRMSMHRGVNVGLVDARVERFNDGEIFVEVYENVRGEDMYVIQPTSNPANDNLLELLIISDALRRSSAARITAVIPYFGYARQDRRSKARTPITAKLVANMMVEAGIERVLTLDLHATQIQGFFDIPVDNLYASPVLRLMRCITSKARWKTSWLCHQMLAAWPVPAIWRSASARLCPSSTSAVVNPVQLLK